MKLDSQRTEACRPDYLVLRVNGVCLVLDCTGARLPRALHWGADLGPAEAVDVAELRRARQPPETSGQIDIEVPASLLLEQSAGWVGVPGLTGHRDGGNFSTSFVVSAIKHQEQRDGVIAHRVDIEAKDDDGEIALSLCLEMLRSGLVRMRGEVTNTGTGVFDLHGFDLALPVPAEATELLDLTGRHLRERAQQRLPFVQGIHLRESRRARGHDASLVLAAGVKGFAWRHGEVHALHVAWSGNTRTYAERRNTGVALLGGGELLLPGEVRLAENERYAGPWVYFSTGSGLDEMAGRFHDHLRSRPRHPRTPRPVLINVWEAVYFDHDLARLKKLADLAASVGVERYVLDDGWFGSRRDISAGLGDWVVSTDVWPNGLAPIVDHVHQLGMQFGLWFEPEMVNVESDVARDHPEWILAAGERLPPPARNQQVLNLAHPQAYAHVRDQMMEILEENRIDFIKWDHNRDLIEAGHRSTGRAAVHEQTLAAYRLIDEIRASHPGLEIESCSGGGGRADLGILERTDRIWASDCIDPLERQLIEAGTSLLLPPEIVGSHVASSVSHTTGRAHSLDFRAGTAFFSHMGIEWDLAAASEQELERLGSWIAAHKAHRELLHSGTVVHGDHPDPALSIHGVVALDKSEAIYAITALASSATTVRGMARLPGLDLEATYDVRPLVPGDRLEGRVNRRREVAWWRTGVRLNGRALAFVGVQAPNLHPEQRVLIHVTDATG